MLRAPISLQPILAVKTRGWNQKATADRAQVTRPEQHGLFIPGRGTADWLTVLASLSIPHHRVQIILIPASAKSPIPSGVLAIWPTNDSGNTTDNDRQRSSANGATGLVHCLKYRCQFSRLWLPEDSQLQPDLTEREFQSFANPDLVYVWHPTSGLIGAERAEVVGCADLLRAPEERFANWDLATPGVELSPRLWSIRSSQAMTADDVVEEGRDGIGESSTDIRWQPSPKQVPTVGEAIRSGVNPISSLFAKAILALTNRAAPTAARRTWINNLEDWARARLSRISERLFEKRNHELIRLMEMLLDDPDQGLRYALPIDSQHSHRGRVTPSDALRKNDVSFNLRDMDGGKPADVWDIPPPIRVKLTVRYRELAEREVTLGRCKRAAYIYAHLLADFRSAARVLESGQHFREAAVLYRDKLNDKLATIRCLEAGGMWSEAIELLESLQMDEQAGDLYTKLEQPKQAAACYRRVVQRYCDTAQYVAAAKLEEEKLSSPQDALRTLGTGFQQTQPIECLSHIFRIQATLGQHSESRDWIDIARQRTAESKNLLSLINLLSSLSTDYPDSGVRQKANDTVLRLVSDALTEQQAGRQTLPLAAILQPLAKMAPDDLLLNRDCRRYTHEFYTARPQVPSSPQRSVAVKHPRIRLVTSVQLNDQREHWQRSIPNLRLQDYGETRWIAAVTVANRPLVFGVCEDVLLGQYLDWDGTNVEQKCARLASPLESGLIARVADSERSVGLAQVGSAVFPIEAERLTGPAGAGPPTVAWQFVGSGSQCFLVQHPTNVASDILGLQLVSLHSWAQIRWHNQTLLLQTVFESGGLTSQVLKHESEIESLELPIPMACNGHSLFIAVGRQLLIVRETHVETVEFAAPIRSIASSVSYTRPRIAVGFDTGVAYLANRFAAAEIQYLCHDAEKPVLQFNRTGHLIVASNGSCEVLDTRNDRLQRVGVFETQQPVAILRTKQSEEFALCSANGTLTRYQILLE